MVSLPNNMIKINTTLVCNSMFSFIPFNHHLVRYCSYHKNRINIILFDVWIYYLNYIFVALAVKRVIGFIIKKKLIISFYTNTNITCNKSLFSKIISNSIKPYS